MVKSYLAIFWNIKSKKSTHQYSDLITDPLITMYIPVCIAQSQQKAFTSQTVHQERQDDLHADQQTGM